VKVLLISILYCLKKVEKSLYSNETEGKGDATNPYLGQAFFALDFEGWSGEFIYLFIYFWIRVVRFCA
jgi:hypothetical protein